MTTSGFCMIKTPTNVERVRYQIQVFARACSDINRDIDEDYIKEWCADVETYIERVPDWASRFSLYAELRKACNDVLAMWTKRELMLSQSVRR